MNSVTTKLNDFVEMNIIDMMKERHEITTRIEREYKNIKLVCSTTFEKYDAQIQEIVLT